MCQSREFERRGPAGQRSARKPENDRAVVIQISPPQILLQVPKYRVPSLQSLTPNLASLMGAGSRLDHRLLLLAPHIHLPPSLTLSSGDPTGHGFRGDSGTSRKHENIQHVSDEQDLTPDRPTE
jgi:hypothetical protein